MIRTMGLCALALLLLTRGVRADETDAIVAELAREAAAWNRADLDGFLSGYERAATTEMIGVHKVEHGWDAIAAMYRKGHPDAAHMGLLKFTELEVRLLSGDYALAVGHWSLERTKEAGGNVGGYFTLTLHKSSAGWRITVDHTS
jgi:ketosteroid isomerase-like protein